MSASTTAYQEIPVNAYAAQTLAVTLSGQPVVLTIYQRSTGLYMDVSLNGTIVLVGVICLNRTFVVRDTYFGMPGDLAFVDTQGTTDPIYTGLGSRYILTYWAGQNAIAS